jgi:hypothetical protein
MVFHGTLAFCKVEVKIRVLQACSITQIVVVIVVVVIVGGGGSGGGGDDDDDVYLCIQEVYYGFCKSFFDCERDLWPN